MSLSDPIADMLTRMRNAANAGYDSVNMPSSKQKVAILDVLKKEGFIKGFKVKEENKKKSISIDLKYFNNHPVIRKLHRVSRPGLRYYISAEKLRPVRNNMGISIISTSQGVMTGRQARKLNLGGELICKLW